MDGEQARAACIIAGFWIGVAVFAWSPHRAGAVHFLAALGIGAAAGRLAWIALHPEALASLLPVLSEPLRGTTVLAVPLGVWIAGVTLPRSERIEFVGAALGPLCVAVSIARIGCLASGCCGAGTLLPIPAIESAATLFLAWRILRCSGATERTTTFAIGFGAVRLSTEPWRPPDADLALQPEFLACCWIAAGVWIGRRSRGAYR